ncbi:protein MONOCULM 1-like [Phoenix dactylifera]|uniref:Protein MONOCULM 1-like n=1 Tax=Phoenix dactylifera TaxID=42345 RepID=A0A8B7BQ48_PHODC|nr:protein MONOCULM 1-like [Phoenix dactylifera]
MQTHQFQSLHPSLTLLSSSSHSKSILFSVSLLASLSSPHHHSHLEMLSSLKSHEEGDQEDPDPHNHHHQQRSNPHQPNPPHGLISLSAHARQLLISCAERIHCGDLPTARRTASLLSAAASPYGDSADRLTHQFARALSLRLDSPSRLASPSPSAASSSSEALQSSYLSLNQVTPFLRFAHLTANQAILEALDGCRRIHILDFDTSHGVQWPPLLQAIAERSNADGPPSIRITGTGTDLSVLRRTGDRLQTFAHSLGLQFQFHPLLLPISSTNSSSPSSSTSTSILSTTTTTTTNLTSSSFQLHPGETLAVNCVLFLHKLLQDQDSRSEDDGSRELRAFLQAVKALNPAAVTVAEREASHNSPIFLQRFMEALDYYTVVFESLEATLPPRSQERLAVEQVWLGREIEDIIAREGEGRRERHERIARWEGLMRGAGFSNLPLSPFALSQAKLLLRLHYPSEGYQLQMAGDSIFLGWQNKALFSVSSWR